MEKVRCRGGEVVSRSRILRWGESNYAGIIVRVQRRAIQAGDAI